MRGQVSFEAVLVSGMAIIVLLSLVNISWERFYMARDVGEAGEARMVAELLAEAINSAYANGDGFSVYLSPAVLNYTRLKSSAITGVALSGAIVVDTRGMRVNVTKSMEKTGGDDWTASASIIPSNITRSEPNAQYSETTVRNSGGRIVIYADLEDIDVQ